MSGNSIDYSMMFGNISEMSNSMARCACVACNSCTCACSCRIGLDSTEINWEI